MIVAGSDPGEGASIHLKISVMLANITRRACEVHLDLKNFTLRDQLELESPSARLLQYCKKEVSVTLD